DRLALGGGRTAGGDQDPQSGEQRQPGPSRGRSSPHTLSPVRRRAACTPLVSGRERPRRSSKAADGGVEGLSEVPIPAHGASHWGRTVRGLGGSARGELG